MVLGLGDRAGGRKRGGVGGGGGGRALGEGFVIRVVLGLGDGAGDDGEEGGVRLYIIRNHKRDSNKY